MAEKYTIESVKREMEKTQLVCKCCHRAAAPIQEKYELRGQQKTMGNMNGE